MFFSSLVLVFLCFVIIDTHSISCHCLVCVRLSHSIKDYLLILRLHLDLLRYLKNVASTPGPTGELTTVPQIPSWWEGGSLLLWEYPLVSGWPQSSRVCFFLNSRIIILNPIVFRIAHLQSYEVIANVFIRSYCTKHFIKHNCLQF